MTCQHCGHNHGASCLACDDAAQVGCHAPCADVRDCEHQPDMRGVKCALCGIPAEMVPPDELQEALWAAYEAAVIRAAGQLGMFDPPKSRCWYYLHTQGGPRRCMVEPDYHDGAHDYEPAR